MQGGIIRIYNGTGRGKSPAALGRAVQAASRGRRVVIIQFLKNKGLSETEFIKRLEPDIKVFRFEKSEEGYDALSPKEREDEIVNIRNGINYARKVLNTGECDMLILDEVLGLVDNGIITVDELKQVLDLKSDYQDIIMTGNTVTESLCDLADEITTITTRFNEGFRPQ